MRIYGIYLATVTVLNEYCSRALRCTPNYDQVETPNEMVHKDFKTYRVRLPDGNTYGTGSGSLYSVIIPLKRRISL